MKLYFATFHDLNYLNKSRALISSLEQHLEDFKIFIVCLDSETFSYYNNLDSKHIFPIRLSEIENSIPQLQKAKKNRSIIEYYFTLSPAIPYYILNTYREIDKITTMDADLYFYSSPEKILDSTASVQITPHNYPKKLFSLNKYGRYNVSFQSFRRDENGISCLEKWLQDCVNWCYDYFDQDKYADQKYLDKWEHNYGNVEIISNPGAGLAPWNLSTYRYELQDETLLVNGNKLIYFHFHHLRIINPSLIIHGSSLYGNSMPKDVMNFAYKPYIDYLIKHHSDVKTDKSLRNNYDDEEMLKRGYFDREIDTGKLKNDQYIPRLYKTQIKERLKSIYDTVRKS